MLFLSINCGVIFANTQMQFAAWNIRIMSDNSRNDEELKQIAKTLYDYDFIAITEVRDEKVLQRTQIILSKMGREYGYQLSPPLGRRVKERVAFLYYKGMVSVVRPGEVYPDDANNIDNFSRDPYWGTFRAGMFDFSVIATHVIWGDSVAGRRAEVSALGNVYRYVQEKNGEENDVLLVGDFNREPNDAQAYSNIMAIPSMNHLFDLPQKSHILESSLYDNIFFQTDYLSEYLGKSGIDKFDETDFGNDDKAANLAVSDHRPVWAVFSIDSDDDGSDVGGQVVPSNNATAKSTTLQKVKPTETPISNVTVYVTRTGSKYHVGTCSSLRRSKIPISLKEAKQKYGACSRCNPPQ